MTLTTTMTNRRRVRLRRANPARLDLTVERITLALAAGFCVLLFPQGGLEALLGALAGAIAARAGSSLVSGALAGLFVGALCAGFFHDALVALVQPLF